MATLIAPGGSVCEVEGDDLIAALKADGFTEADVEKKSPARRASSKSKSDD